MTPMTPAEITTQRNRLIVDLCGSIIDAVAESGPSGIPGGTLYAGLMSAGCTMQQFDALMELCVRSGRITKSGQLYYAGEGANGHHDPTCALCQFGEKEHEH